MGITVKMFPAGSGDSFLVQANNCNILIDGGFIETYKRYIRKELLDISTKGHCLDLLVVTHMDKDHILGAIAFLEENRAATNPSIIGVRDIWFNCYSHLPIEHTEESVTLSTEEQEILHSYLQIRSSRNASSVCVEPISGTQGLSLAYLMLDGGYPLNKAINKRAVESTNQSIKLYEDIEITIISPSPSQLSVLAHHWRTELRKHRRSFSFTRDPLFNAAMESFLLSSATAQDVYAQSISSKEEPTDMSSLLARQSGTDKSIPNASSIAFLLEARSKRLLFLGDAHEEQILNELRRFQSEPNTLLHFDLIKVSHHASLKNSASLFDTIDAKIFLISTDGTDYGHPDLATLARIVARETMEERILVFNYPNEGFYHFSNYELMRKYNYRVVLDSDANGIQI